MVQGLRLYLPVGGVQVRSMVGELKSHVPCGQIIKRKQYCNKLKPSEPTRNPPINSIKTLKKSDQIRSVAQSCPTLCDPMNHSTPGLPIHHQLPEFTQTHVHRVSDAIQPSHPLSSPSPPAPNPSQHQSLFQ